MSFDNTDGLLTVNFDVLTTLAIGVLVLFIGVFAVKKFKVFRTYCIPAPVIGGFLVMIITCICHVSNVFTVSFDSFFQNILMVAFFTSIGFSANFQTMKKGGKTLLKYWLCAGIIGLCQIPIALGIGNLLGMENAYSITAGSISMCGGHGASTAYGATLVDRGYETAQACALACATFGLISAVLLGGPLARRLVIRYKLENPDKKAGKKANAFKSEKNTTRDSLVDVSYNVGLIIICMAAGSILAKLASEGLGALSGNVINLPDYLVSMLLAVLVRNVMEKFKGFHYTDNFCSGFQSVTLNIFLSIAMMSIKLWLLVNLIGGLLVIVLVQVAVMGLYTYFFVFRFLGKNYDAALMVAGLCGHALGATPTAMANMEAVFNEFGFRQTPLIVVSLVGGFLNDLIYQPANIIVINTLIPSIV